MDSRKPFSPTSSGSNTTRSWSPTSSTAAGTIFTTRAVGSLVVRTSDSRPEGLGSMPDATKYPPSTQGVRAS
ncbi:hypothetical protein TNCV_3098241 [Trichonephila clavipes]|nr:hypothetical protein TNCV_3098241 [Trichonephila clavipes]